MGRKGRVAESFGEDEISVEKSEGVVRFNGLTMTAEPISKDRMKVTINGRKIKFDRDEFMMMFVFFDQMRKVMDEDAYGSARMYN